MEKLTKVITESEAWTLIREDLLGIDKELLADIIIEQMQTGVSHPKWSLREVEEEVNSCCGTISTYYMVIEDDNIEAFKAAKVLYETNN